MTMQDSPRPPRSSSRTALVLILVALVVLAIAGALVFIGKSRLDSDSLVPRRTLRSLREDEAWLRERLR